MKHLSIDIETFSDESIGDTGLYKYAQSDSFEILLFAYSVNFGMVQAVDLARGEKIPDFVIEASQKQHNLKPRPQVPIKQ